MSIRNLFLCLALFLPACSATSITNETTNSDGSCKYKVYRHDPNGWIVNSPVVHFVFWGSYWQSTIVDTAVFFTGNGSAREMDAYQAIWTSTVADPLFLARLDEYGIRQVVLDSTLYNTNQFSSDGTMSKIDDATIPTELNNEIQAGKLPVPTSNDMFVIFLPLGTQTNKLVDGNFVGYHNYAHYGDVYYTFAIIKYAPYDFATAGYYNTNMTVSHEMYEAWTNPDLSSGYYDGNFGEGEIGDLCDWQAESSNGNSYQKVWSQGACQCK